VKLGLPHINWLERLRTERRQYFDEKVDGALWDLLETAALLEIKEFALFEMAYKDWYGRFAVPNVMESHYANYMFSGVIPIWVRGYCRKVIELNRAGQLDPRKLGIYRPQPSRRLILIGKLYAAALLVMFLVMTYMAFTYTVDTNPKPGEVVTEQSPHYNAMP